MALTLNAEQKSIYQIFSGENQYIIPPYQRAYSWTIVQCKALFEDIKKAFYATEQEGYFLGNIVLAKSREERNKLEVIDGQQRLATLTLLLKVLLSFDKENKALHNAIWIEDRRTDKEIQRVETNIFMEKDFNYFKEVLAFDFSTNICDSIKIEDNLFKKNICYFYNELKEFQKHNDIFKFSDFLLDSIYILPIETEDNNADKARKNALRVFETINNRGLNLATSDIFKARLYSMALNELEHKEFIIKWRELVQYCNELNCEVDDIFRIYIAIIQNENNIEIIDETDYDYDEDEGNIPIQKMELKNFFLEKESSPFFYKTHNMIMNDLLKICKFAILFIETIQNPSKNQELSKWFQFIHISLGDRLIIEYDIYISFYESNLDNYGTLINTSKKIILNSKLKERLLMCYKFEMLDDENLLTIQYYLLSILLGICLDREKKAIFPYYFINKNLKSIVEDSYSTKYDILNLEFLTNIYPELEDIDTQEALRLNAHNFIFGLDEDAN